MSPSILLRVPLSRHPQRLLLWGCTALESHAGCSNNKGVPSRAGAHPGRPAVDSSQRGCRLCQQEPDPHPLCQEKQRHCPENSTFQTNITHFLNLAYQSEVHCSLSNAIKWAQGMSSSPCVSRTDSALRPRLLWMLKNTRKTLSFVAVIWQQWLQLNTWPSWLLFRNQTPHKSSSIRFFRNHFYDNNNIYLSLNIQKKRNLKRKIHGPSPQ